MTRNHLEQLLCLVFQVEGAVDAAGLARRAARDFELAERDRQIYDLRAELCETEISHRFHLTRRRVQQIVHEQMVIRRSCA